MLTTIQRDIIKKPKLGGWKHKITGIKYLNADSQTGPRPRRIPLEKTCTRDTQTILNAEKDGQTTYEQATQMWRSDHYIPSTSDKYITVEPYISFDEIQKSQNLRVDKNAQARIIQRCYRAYRILKFIKLCARLYRKMREDCEKLGEEKALAIRERYLEDCRALQRPRTLLDLDALINYLEKSELDDQDLDPSALLESKRRVYLAAYARLRHEQELRIQNTMAGFLKRQCGPVRWMDKKNKPLEMLTLRNQAAREFMEFYNNLADPVAENRLDILLEARCSIEHHECKDAIVFRNLLNQEIVMLSNDVPSIKFNFLRNRILGAFLQFAKVCHNCTCKAVTGTEDISLFDFEFREPLEKKQFFCISCTRLLSVDKFPATAKNQPIQRCKACVRLLRNMRRPVDLRPYENMLKVVREEEGPGSLADNFSVHDLYHLVLHIWHGRSALSERTDPYELSLPRYELSKPWSPWNCLVVTRQEAEMHRCIGGGDHYYSIHLRRKILSAHCAARMEFRGLVLIEKRKKNENKIEDSNSTQ